MKKLSFVLVALSLSAIGFAQGPDNLSFLSLTSPANCGTSDNAVVSAATLFGGSNGFGCIKTLILPQFAVGNGWNSQVTVMMPTQPTTAGLVTGTQPGFAYFLSLGNGATATLPGNNSPVSINTAQNGCMGLWSAIASGAGRSG